MSRRNVWFGVLVGVPLGVLYLWLAVRKVDLSQVWETLIGAQPGLVALAVAGMGRVYALHLSVARS